MNASNALLALQDSLVKMDLSETLGKMVLMETTDYQERMVIMESQALRETLEDHE